MQAQTVLYETCWHPFSPPLHSSRDALELSFFSRHGLSHRFAFFILQCLFTVHLWMMSSLSPRDDFAVYKPPVAPS